MSSKTIEACKTRSGIDRSGVKLTGQRHSDGQVGADPTEARIRKCADALFKKYADKGLLEEARLAKAMILSLLPRPKP